MTVAVSVEVDGATAVVSELLRFEDRAEDMSPALRQVADVMRGQFGQRFSSEGPGWAPLKPATLAAKRSAGLSERILEATGAGEASLTESGGDNVEHVTADTLVFGSSLSRMKLHDTGTSRMPQRKVVDFSLGDRREHVRVLQRFLLDGDSVPYRLAVGI